MEFLEFGSPSQKGGFHNYDDVSAIADQTVTVEASCGLLRWQLAQLQPKSTLRPRAIPGADARLASPAPGQTEGPRGGYKSAAADSRAAWCGPHS